MIPRELNQLIESSLSIVRSNSQHSLPPSYRQLIYTKIDEIKKNKGMSLRVHGFLGVSTARKVLNVWKDAMPLWKEEDISEIRDLNHLPEYMLELAEGILGGKVDTQIAQQEASDTWYVVGNIGEEIFEWMDNGPRAAYYACDAARKALHEVLGKNLLSEVSDLDQRSDEELLDRVRDSASSAVIAYSGAVGVPPENIQKRLSFWEWWLTEAIPAAWDLAADHTDAD